MNDPRDLQKPICQDDLRELRKAVHLSQGELASRAKVSIAVVCWAETRGLRLTPDQERRIRAVLLDEVKYWKSVLDRAEGYRGAAI